MVLTGYKNVTIIFFVMDLNKSVGELLQWLGFGTGGASVWTSVILLAAVVLVALLVTMVFRRLIVPAVRRVTAKTKAKWDDYLFNDRVMSNLSGVIAPLIWYALLPVALPAGSWIFTVLQRVCMVYLIAMVLRLISSFLSSLYEISSEHEKLRNRPLKGIYQMVNLVVIIIGVIVMISVLIDKDATTILAGLGASAAVLILVFKDSILGLVAGVQLSANDMLRPGDWITMSKYGADGYVQEVSLTTVKVRNFDKTITTIPPYALVSDSYQNWRGMWESGGRRIKRSLSFDVGSVRFCSREEKALYKSEGWISEDEARDDCELVNLYAFRKYVTSYLQRNKSVRSDMMLMVRQLQPTSEGVPVEVYCFVNTTEWVEYERIQSDLFDHLIAAVPRFGLRIYQRVSGFDIRR